MNERFYTLRYMVLWAVAASAVAVFLFPERIPSNLPEFNLFVTLFIYYNYMALNDPTKEKRSLAGPFLVVHRKMTFATGIKTNINIARACLLAFLIGVPAGLSAQKADRLDDKDPAVRSRAAEEAGREGAAGADAAIKRLPAEKDPAVALQLVHSLGQSGDPAAVKTLADQSASGVDAGIRAEACMALSSFPKNKDAEAALRKALLRDGEEDNVRISAAYSLLMGFRESKTAVSALETALKKGGKTLKAGIIDNLRHIARTQEGKYLLGVAYADTDPELKGSAGKIIYGVDVKEGRDSRRK